MKKRAVPKDEKLRLHRETLRALESTLSAAAGGATTISCDIGSCFVTCNSRNTCTSRLC